MWTHCTPLTAEGRGTSTAGGGARGGGGGGLQRGHSGRGGGGGDGDGRVGRVRYAPNLRALGMTLKPLFGCCANL
jgi:hypothetical protein